MDIKYGDFVEIEYDLYANSKLVQTSKKESAEKENLNSNEEFKPMKIIIGKNMFLPKFEDKLVEETQGEEKKLDLKCLDAFGKKDKKLLRTFPQSSFTEKKIRAVVGQVYDFNGMYGLVKSVNSSRVLVDFNHPLSGCDISITYKIVKKIEEIKTQVELVLEIILKLPKNVYEVVVQKNICLVKVPKEIFPLKEQIEKTLRTSLIELDAYKINFEEKVVKKS